MSVVTYLTSYLPSTLSILETAATVVAAIVINRIIFHNLINRLARKTEVEEHYVKPLKHASSIVIYLIAFFVILSIFNIKGSLTGLLTGAGIAGIVIGMATKDVLSGAISGIILFLTRPFKIGDWVKINGTEGIVRDLTLQRTEINTFNGESVSIPNLNVAQSKIINKTKKPKSRIDISVGVDYDTNLDEAANICQRILDSEEDVLKERDNQILVEEFGESSINLILRFWIDRNEIQERGVGIPEMKSNLRNKIIEKFREKEIEMPFPHMEIIKKE